MPTAIELRELEDDELDTRLLEYRREILNLRFQLATGQLDNYARLNDAKRNVARVLTVLRDREIALAEGREAGPIYVEAPIRPARRRPADDVLADDETTEDEVTDDEFTDDGVTDDDVDGAVAETDEVAGDEVDGADDGVDEEDE
jgi:large subunit ribosomal protein L29